MSGRTLSRTALFVILIAFEALCALRLSTYINSSMKWSLAELPYIGDFNHYYATALAYDEGVSPYCIPLQELPAKLSRGHLLDKARWHAVLPNASNPPVFALLTLPLAWLPIEEAWFAWEAVLLSSLVLSVLVIGRTLKWNSLETAFATVILLQSSPAIHNLRFGQVQPLLLLLFVLGWTQLKKGREILGGVVWGAAVAVKFYLWPVVPLCLLMRRWKAFGAATISLGAVTAVPFLIYGAGVYDDFSRCGKPLIEKSGLFFPMNYSIGGIVQHFRLAFQIPILKSLDAEFFFQYYLAPLVVCGALLIVLVVKLRKRDDALDLLTGCAAYLGILSSPVAWPHYYIFPFVLAAFCYRRQQPYLLLLLLASTLVIPFDVPAIKGLSEAGKIWFAVQPLLMLPLFAAAFYSSRKAFDPAQCTSNGSEKH